MSQRTGRKSVGMFRVLFLAALLATTTAMLAGSVRDCAADDEPKPDPAGIATGDRTSVYDAGGTSFIVPEPTDKSAPDYGDKLKDYQAFQAQAEKEPLAMKLADGVGHVRLGTNFGWTLNTGYLVLFMQAGFALLTCGLIRKKNAGHLMMLNFAAYVFAFIAYYAVGYAFQFGAVAVNAAPLNLGGTPTLNAFLVGGGSWGWLGGKGFFLSGPAYDAGANCLMLFEVVFMETAGYIIVGAICERITFWAFLLCEIFVGAILYPVFGCWVWGGGWLSQIGSTLHLGHGCQVGIDGDHRNAQVGRGERGAGIEPHPAEEENERARHDKDQIVRRESPGFAVLAILAQARAKDQGQRHGAEPADRVDHGRTGEVHVAVGQVQAGAELR
jgi:hypothetical protein